MLQSSSRPIIAQTAVPSQSFSQLEPLLKHLKSTEALMLLGCIVLVGLVSFLDQKVGTRKGKLAKGRLGGEKEKAAAMRVAFKQIEDKRHNEAALYIGRPSQSLNNKPPIFFPDAQRGIAIVGGPGSGKTDSAILPMIFSAIDQGKPCLIWDFKYPTLTKKLVGYGAKQGYDVRIFAPGYPESEVCNPLDFLEGEDDSLMARQFAEVLNRNFKKSNQASEDQFFSVAADQLTEAILMLTKGTKYDDLMMCQAILSLTDLPKRLMEKKGSINPWVYASFGQLISVAQSERTVSSIIATANNSFTTFMKAKILSSFCGKTTIPLTLQGKQLLIMGLDREKRDVLAPLIATIIDLIVSRNVVRERSDPLFLFLDEVPTLYLPRLVNWLNENREDGLCTILGFQNIVQLEKIYGRELARAILGACATKLIFNPQDGESARFFSDLFGEEEIHFKQKSRGHSGGKASTNISEQDRTKKLIDPSDILKMPKGKSIIIGPGFHSRGEAYVPIVEKIRLSSSYVATKLKSQLLWSSIREQMVKQSSQRAVSKQDLQKRYDLADELYAMPEEKSNPQSVHRVNTQPVGRLDEEQFAKMS